MCRARFRSRRADRLRAAIAAVLLALAALLGGPAAAAPGDGEILVLAATLNGEAVGEPLVVRRAASELFVRGSDLRAAGLTAVGEDEVALSDVPGLRWVLDEHAQQIAFVLAERRVTSRFNVGGAVRERMPVTPASWGAILAYDATASAGAGRLGASALVDASFFSPAGRVFATAVAGSGGVRRLDTGFTAADTEHARRLVVGDFVGGDGKWGRPVRMGGVRYGTDFSLRPEEATFPLPDLAGTASAPSTVDLIVNGAKRASNRVAAGGFAMADLPVRAGANTVAVAVRDVLGRETVRTVSLYASRGLLRPGLNAFSVEAGWVRTGYASPGDQYRAPIVSGEWRRGITDALTLGTIGQADRRGGALGGTATLGLRRLAQLDLAADASVRDGQTGARLRAGVERMGGRFSLAARYTRTLGQWRDVASRYGAPVRRDELLANIGFDLGRAGTANLGLVALSHDRLRRALDEGTVGTLERSSVTGGRAGTQLVTASYSVRLWRGATLLASAGRDLAGGGGYVLLGAAASLGSRTSGYAGGRWTGAGGASASAELSRRAVESGQFGFQLAAGTGDRQTGGDRAAAAIEYQGVRGWYGIQGERIGGVAAVRASAHGSLIVGQEGVYLGGSVPGSVALVDAGGHAGVPVYRDNRPVGVTDRRGRLAVAGLNPFEETHLSLKPEDVSDHYAVRFKDVVIRPPERAGVRVHFDLEQEAALLVRLVDGRGMPLPPGSRARIAGEGAGSDHPLGMEGELFVERPPGSGELLVMVRTARGGSCEARVRVPANREAVTKVPAAMCMPVRRAMSEARTTAALLWRAVEPAGGASRPRPRSAAESRGLGG